MGRISLSEPLSLDALVRRELGSQAGAEAVSAGVRALAKANRLKTDAVVPAGASLEVPESFERMRTVSPVVAEGITRLGGVANHPENPRLALARKAKLLDLKPVFSNPLREVVGPVALPPIAGVKVEGTIERFVGMKTWIGDGALQTVAGDLGKLTAAEFAAVHAEMGGRSHVKWEAKRRYDVRDFLPMELQALVDRDLDLPEAVKIKGVKVDNAGMATDDEYRTVALTMNCHATAWEAVRAYQGEDGEVDIYYGDMVQMDGLTHTEAGFEKLADIPAGQLDQLMALDLRPGDLVQFHDTNEFSRVTMLLHSAVYVGGGLFFEKPNTEGDEKSDPEKYQTQEETPFRLATAAMMAEPIAGAVEGRYRIEVFRAKAELEPASKAFESSLEDAFRSVAKEQGLELGNQLVTEFEPGMGGGIRAEHASALETVALTVGADGRGAIDTNGA